MNRKNVPSLFAAGLTFALVCVWMQIAIGNASNPPASKTGAPNENTCIQCHGGTAGTGSTSMIFGANETQYVPGQTYTIQVNVTDATKLRFGYEITALAGGVGASVGTFTVTNINQTRLLSGTVTGFSRTYVSHRSASSVQNWSFDWTAPPTDIGPITFFLSGVAANNNNNDNGDKVYATSFTISAVPPPAPVASFGFSQNNLCPGESITFSDSSSHAATYQWTFPGGNPASSTLANPIVNYANPGIYSAQLIVSNVTGSDTLLIDSFITVNSPPTMAALSNPASCFGGSDGSLLLTVSGTSGFSYLWSNGSTSANPTGLQAGSYSVTVTDGNGCTASSTFVVGEASEIQLTTNSSPASCGTADGIASVSASGGTPGYTYLWSNGATGASADSLLAGVYSVTVTDSNGCQQTSSVPVSNTGAPTGTVMASPVACFGDANGEIDLTVIGGVQPYSYLWSTGDTTEDLTGLLPGTYSVTVNSADGCILTELGIVTEPAALQIGLSTLPEINGNDGSISANIQGGTAPFSYLWSNGSTDSTISGLSAGTYSLTVTDARGCTKTETATVFLTVSAVGALEEELFRLPK